MTFLRQVKEFNLPSQWQCPSIPPWLSPPSPPPSVCILQDLYASRYHGASRKDHGQHKLFETLPSGKRLWSIKTKPWCCKNSFCPTAVGFINKAQDPHWDSHPTTCYIQHQSVCYRNIIWIIMSGLAHIVCIIYAVNIWTSHHFCFKNGTVLEIDDSWHLFPLVYLHQNTKADMWKPAW